ncbi:MAG: nucleotidyltransferase family protein [Prevotella sp.]|nr:nucleotidyltransferase family protein [Prevotella sp.]
MNIIQRNFFRLLRAGVFHSEEQIEPMSAWKWKQVLEWARQLNVAPLLYDGVDLCGEQPSMRLTDELREAWRQHTLQANEQLEQAEAEVAELLLTLGRLQLRPILMEPWPTAVLYAHPAHRRKNRVSIYFPFSTQGKKADEWAEANGTGLDSPQKHLLQYEWKGLHVEHRHRMFQLSNKVNNMTLQNIIEQEWLDGGTSHTTIGGQRIETVGPTLYLLVSLLSIIKTTLSEGLALWQMADLGMLLRRQGDQVDFVKLQEWIERLHFGRMAQLSGQVLTGLLGFSADEVPFMPSAPNNSNADSLANDLLGTEGSSGSSRYLRYCPGESLSSLMASITHSLGNVEE